MSMFLKILAVVGAICFLGVAACAGAGAIALRGTKAMMAEAETFAATHDQYACESSAFDKAELCDGTLCLLKVTAWHATCLDKATPNPGYCDDVPHPDDIASESWSVEACARVEMDDPESCRMVLGATQALCHNAQWTGKSNGVTVSVAN